MRLSVESRRLIGEAIDRGVDKSTLAKVLSVTPRTVRKWDTRRAHLLDRKRKPKVSKITAEVEASILALRSLKWGTARIQQSLFCMPPFLREILPDCVQEVQLSRTAINNVLKKHKVNGYQSENEGWKFFRASKPNELWQIDLKGPYTIGGKAYHYLVCIDDYSRYLLVFEQLDHVPTTKEVASLLQPLVEQHHPENILSDNGAQFKEQWKQWCCKMEVTPLFAHPYYPQDKGKVERTIRNVTEEFLQILKMFPEKLCGKCGEYKKWFNEQRFHRGILAIPCTLFRVLGNFT